MESKGVNDSIAITVFFSSKKRKKNVKITTLIINSHQIVTIIVYFL